MTLIFSSASKKISNKNIALWLSRWVVGSDTEVDKSDEPPYKVRYQGLYILVVFRAS